MSPPPRSAGRVREGVEEFGGRAKYENYD